MKEYHSKAIRNVAILGHLGSGKTTLTESLLFAAKAIDKKGEVEKKSTVSDYTLEEQTRQTSLVASVAPCEWNGYKVNFMDIPGSEELIGELDNVLSVVKGAILIVDAASGVQVGTERCWNELQKRGVPTIFFINKMDKENIKYDEVVEAIKAMAPAAFEIGYPTGTQDAFKGCGLVADKKALPGTEDKIEELYESLCEEIIAAQSDELMEKIFGGEELTAEEVKGGLRSAVMNHEVYPIIAGSSTKNIGIADLLNVIVDYMPSPEDLHVKEALNAQGDKIQVKVDDAAPLAAYVFKTIVDPFVGTISLFKVISGCAKVGMDVYIPNLDKTVKLPQLFVLMGKTQIQVEQAFAGDIIAVSKLAELEIGYTLCDPKQVVKFEMPEYPTPIYYVAVKPKNKQDEEKISSALKKISQEDPTFEFKRNPETNQLLIGGQGKLHLDFIIDKLKNTFKVDVDTEDPKIIYRETIRGRTTGEKGVQGRHKKQSGGAGQFGDVWIKFEPTDEVFVFEEQIFGGSVPKNYFPAVEKGLRQAMEKGPLAGFPVEGVKAILVDGSYHPVDSNEVSFVLAAKLAWQAAIKEVKPTIKEPIYEMKIVVKSDYVGDIMSDMSKRRGRILDQQPIGNGLMEVTAEAPEAEIIKYAIELKTMTQASGRFSRSFLRYDFAPEEKIKKIIEEYKDENN